jgi:drug/metabolite transporter (DMT)-like permease
MVAIWGTNFSLVKVAMRDFPELAFNAFRLVIASGIFLGALWWQRGRVPDGQARLSLSRTDWLRLAFLGIVGHLMYQLFFLGGVKRTSVANGSLIMGTTPVVVALLTAWTGHERVPPLRWLGAAMSFAGLYVYSLSFGCLLYVLVSVPTLMQVDWVAISRLSWFLMVASGVFALAVSYLIWYTSVQKAGSTRTAAWSNLTPVIATGIAAVWLGEPVSLNQVVGSIVIFAGLIVTRRA